MKTYFGASQEKMLYHENPEIKQLDSWGSYFSLLVYFIVIHYLFFTITYFQTVEERCVWMVEH